ncbi:MAG: hypothetical protein K5634_05065 [Sphaerochaetaceae bacterium]|nr:hypothetical protein [Sphaerochaetaceae bacterium]
MANKNKKNTVSAEEKRKKSAAFIRLLYGFIGIIVSAISIIACIVYKGPVYMVVSFVTLLVISVIFIISGMNLYKN